MSRKWLGLFAVLLFIGWGSLSSSDSLLGGERSAEDPRHESNGDFDSAAGENRTRIASWIEDGEGGMQGSYRSLLAGGGGKAAQGPGTEREQDPDAGARGDGARGGRGGRGRGDGEGEWEGEGRGEREERDTDKDKRGIPVTEPLIHQKCTACHKPQEDGRLSRISYMRKTPEGWELSLKRMIRLNKVELTPEEARKIVRYLANDHGLARSEAERSLYEVERRVHWSEEDEGAELRASCGECHTLGRVYSERRDAEEWKLLKATHLAFFPLADFQAFRGRSRGSDNFDWESASEAEIQDRMESRNSSSRGADQADRVLAELAKELPLFTPEWEAWEVNRREVPVAGTWQVIGHEAGRGDVRGTLEITRVEEDTYETTWQLTYGDGRTVKRTGKGLLYAGYSWRGRSNTTAPKEAPMLRSVLLLNDDWDTFTGRLFTGEYNELGMDITLHRRAGRAQIFHVDGGALRTPSTGNRVDLIGDAFPEDLSAADLYAGEGVTITALDRISEHLVQLRVDVAEGTEHGRRFLSMGAERGPAGILIHDGIDYIKVTPGEGLARVGGKMRPPMLERFEAVGMNRGKDGKRWTDDDVEVRVVPATWSIEEFPIREGDDDAQFVGSIDPDTGVFTPGLDGPNPERQWSANNIGDVYVVATCTLEAPVRSDKEDEEGDEGERGGRSRWSRDSDEGEDSDEEGEDEDAEEEEPEEPEEELPLVYEEQELRARGHLVVTVQVYVKWDTYQMNQR